MTQTPFSLAALRDVRTLGGGCFGDQAANIQEVGTAHMVGLPFVPMEGQPALILRRDDRSFLRVSRKRK